MATKAQLQFKALRDKAVQIEKDQGDNVWTEDATKAYQAVVAEAEGLA